MTLSKYLFLMILATVLCWGAWGLVLVFVNPFETGIMGLVFFYAALFLGLLGVFSILGFLLRFVFKQGDFAYQQVKTAFRQGFLFALLLTAAVFLQGMRLLVWWNLILLVVLVGVVEYVLQSSSRAKRSGVEGARE